MDYNWWRKSEEDLYTSVVGERKWEGKDVEYRFELIGYIEVIRHWVGNIVRDLAVQQVECEGVEREGWNLKGGV